MFTNNKNQLLITHKLLDRVIIFIYHKIFYFKIRNEKCMISFKKEKKTLKLLR